MSDVNVSASGAPPSFLTPTDYGMLDALDALVTVLAIGNPNGVLTLGQELTRRGEAVLAKPPPTQRETMQRWMPLFLLATRCSELAGRSSPELAEDEPAVTDIVITDGNVFTFPKRPAPIANDDGSDPAA